MPNKQQEYRRDGGRRRPEFEATASSRVIPFPACQSFLPAAVPNQLPPQDVALLDEMRWWLLKSLAASKAHLEEACFLLDAEKDASAEPYAVAFFGTLSQGARRRMVFYRPGTSERSEDEHWLIRLLSAVRTGDEASARALIAWRVTPASQRRLRFLLDRLVAFGRKKPWQNSLQVIK